MTQGSATGYAMGLSGIGAVGGSMVLCAHCAALIIEASISDVTI